MTSEPADSEDPPTRWEMDVKRGDMLSTYEFRMPIQVDDLADIHVRLLAAGASGVEPIDVGWTGFKVEVESTSALLPPRPRTVLARTAYVQAVLIAIAALVTGLVFGLVIGRAL